MQLDASESFDDDGSIVDYDWDLDNVGEFSVDGGTNPTIVIQLPDEPAAKRVAVRVTDNDGLTATADILLRSTGWASNMHPDDTATKSWFSSITAVDGLPAVSYAEVNSSGDLMYVRATDSDGGGWQEPRALDSAAGGIYATSLVVVAGVPAISYGCNTSAEDEEEGEIAAELRLYPRDRCCRRKLTVPILLDGTTDETLMKRRCCSSAAGRRLPYRDGTVLSYLHATDAEGTAWAEPIVVDAESIAEFYCDMALVDGNPAISYCDVTEIDLKYAARQR